MRDAREKTEVIGYDLFVSVKRYGKKYSAQLM